MAEREPTLIKIARAIERSAPNPNRPRLSKKIESKLAPADQAMREAFTTAEQVAESARRVAKQVDEWDEDSEVHYPEGSSGK